jgi:hypothetical protein
MIESFIGMGAGVLALGFLVLTLFKGCSVSRRLGGIVGKAIFYGYMGVAAFFVFSASTMFVSAVPSLNALPASVKGVVLMPIAAVASLFWYFSFRELEKLDKIIHPRNKRKRAPN